ncbi:kinesin-like protein KIN-6 isoform X2 [Malus sylvestris]|uniref:kinesin-like protein KIN-6 isoform X2 n=1 Tax=Malus sylvestris TaxID=3752 RepID=UPI0021AD2A89|nr:kinesin-like protein KIN-6 isoform X2 [Malus sylvestris]
MEINSPAPGPNTVTVRRNPHRRARPTPTPATAAREMQIPSSIAPGVRSFPTQEILSMDVAKTNPVAENLRVFLRIRPLVPCKLGDKTGGFGADQNPKPRLKNAWPQNPAKKKSAAGRSPQINRKIKEDVCIKVNTSHSVTLSPPLALQESNRTKTEVYEGFSHVFSSDSSQEEVYDKMVKPLVEEFLRGKSGMLAALGPSGSGKTHTVFGCPRQPGMVPLALQHIFNQTSGSISESSRSFFISIFEISSERGKGERLFDLSPNGGDLSMQQSTLRGLQEIPISDARQAESLIAQAMLKRATGMTNANSQSSRSQCIINIRAVADKCNGDDNNQANANDGVLTIVDLAGAEREKRTGNQGARLLESNFINNTSMVIGLCLRSLLEHQKNPKKPLQKHFQNSLLTKYLRDYLEGKKRMALILTVKSGEEDYRDTSYVLRQASPFMEIKYNYVEEPSNISYPKRHFQALSRTEQRKKMKVTDPDACTIEERKSIEAENALSKEGSVKSSGCVDSYQGERNHRIMQSFSKAIWNVLKQYKEKLKVADDEIQHLRQNLMTEHTRCLELEKELKDVQSCCSCSNREAVEVSLSGVGGQESSNLYEVKSLDVGEVSTLCLELENPNQQDHQTCERVSGSEHSATDLCESISVRLEDSYLSVDVAGFIVDSYQSLAMHRKDSCSSVELDDLLSEGHKESSKDISLNGYCNAVDLLDGESALDTSCQVLQTENLVEVASTGQCNGVDLLDCESGLDTSCQAMQLKKSEYAPSTGHCNAVDLVDGESLLNASCQALQTENLEEVALTGQGNGVDLLDCESGLDISCQAIQLKKSEDVPSTGHCNAVDLLDGESSLDTSCQALRMENLEEVASTGQSNGVDLLDCESGLDTSSQAIWLKKLEDVPSTGLYNSVDLLDGESALDTSCQVLQTENLVEVASTGQCNGVDLLDCESGLDTSCQAMQLKKSEDAPSTGHCIAVDLLDGESALDTCCQALQMENLEEVALTGQCNGVDLLDCESGLDTSCQAIRWEKSECVLSTGHYNVVSQLDCESGLDTSCQALQLEKSERRASPSSSPSPKDFSAVDVEDEIQKPRELLNFPTSPKVDLVSTKGCDVIEIPDSKPRESRVLDAKDEIQKPWELFNFPTSLKEDLVSTKGCNVIEIPDSEPRDSVVLDAKGEIEKPQTLLNVPTSLKEDLVSTKGRDAIDVTDSEPGVKISTKTEKPKRRLLPASSLLLRDFSALDIDDDEKPKRGKKKSGAVEERHRTQGSISLLRLLHRNLPS